MKLMLILVRLWPRSARSIVARSVLLSSGSTYSYGGPISVAVSVTTTPMTIRSSTARSAVTKSTSAIGGSAVDWEELAVTVAVLLLIWPVLALSKATSTSATAGATAKLWLPLRSGPAASVSVRPNSSSEPGSSSPPAFSASIWACSAASRARPPSPAGVKTTEPGTTVPSEFVASASVPAFWSASLATAAIAPAPVRVTPPSVSADTVTVYSPVSPPARSASTSTNPPDLSRISTSRSVLYSWYWPTWYSRKWVMEPVPQPLPQYGPEATGTGKSAP